MTLQEMLGQVRVRIDEPAEGSQPFWYNAELIQRLHDAQGYIYRKMVRAKDNLFLESTDISLTASQSTYNLPLNARLGASWALIENRITSSNPPLYVFDIRFQDHLMMEGPIGVSDPSDANFFAVREHDQLRITPTPGASHTDGVRFWYNPMYGNMHQGTVAASSGATTSILFPETPTFNRGSTSIGKIDKRDDYYNGMDVEIVSDSTTPAAEGQVARITDYTYDSDNTRGTATVTGLSTVASATAIYAVRCPIPEDFHNVVVLRAAWAAAGKRPRLRPSIEAEYIDEYQEAIGFVTEEQTFRGDQVIPIDQGSY